MTDQPPPDGLRASPTASPPTVSPQAAPRAPSLAERAAAAMGAGVLGGGGGVAAPSALPPAPSAPPPAAPLPLAERAAATFGAGAVLGAAAAPAPVTAPTSVAIGAGSAAALAEPPPRPAPPPPPSAPPAPPPAAPPPAAPGTISAATIEAAGAVGALGTRSRASEEIAVVQNQVLRTMRAATTEGGRNPRLILVTSALPDEGKTFTSLNLAAAIARMSPQPVLLVDADGKPGAMSELLGCGRLDGLRALAQRPGAPVQPLVVPTAFERLSFLPYGRPVEGMPPVPSAPSIAGALLRVAEALPRHVLIIDSPPALSTSEATTLAPIVGQVLVVVRAETTQRNEVEAALDMLDACPTLQLVLNQARVSSSDSFGVYGYEAYGVYPKP